MGRTNRFSIATWLLCKCRVLSGGIASPAMQIRRCRQSVRRRCLGDWRRYLHQQLRQAGIRKPHGNPPGVRIGTFAAGCLLPPTKLRSTPAPTISIPSKESGDENCWARALAEARRGFARHRRRAWWRRRISTCHSGARAQPANPESRATNMSLSM